MNTVNLKINNIPVVAPEGATILEAAHLAGIRIPYPVLPQGDQCHRRLPHLRMRGKGRPRPGRCLRYAGK